MSERRDYSPGRKALQINLDDSIYGTFAEIGAGQEVARHFFQAGRASHTIAKTISAYDMTFSDQIYGKESRYVCESRLVHMLDHEFNLLQERLKDQRGQNTRFFAFADTVSTASQEDGASKSHGWMGIRFQARPGGPANEIVLHVKLWDRFRLAQQEALGSLGVNLVHMAFFPPENPEERIAALVDNLSTRRIEVNMIRFSGPDLNQIDNRLTSLALVKQHLTEAVLFNAKGEVQHVGDALFRAPLLVQRGSFNPVTKTDIEIADKVFKQFQNHPLTAGTKPKAIFEITMNSLSSEAGRVNDQDFLQRVDMLNALGKEVLVSNFQLFYQMKSFLRQYTDCAIGIVVNAAWLGKMFDEAFYKSLPGGILEGMSRLFDENTRVFVVPHKDESICSTAKTFHPQSKLEHLYRHLTANDWITDVLQCDDLDTSIQSADVRTLLNNGDSKWKTMVPTQVADLITKKKLKLAP